MLLRDSFEDAVGDVVADLPTLTTASRRRGVVLCRRRRATVAVGSLAAATVLAVGAYAALPGGGAPDVTVATDAPAPEVGVLTGGTAPITAGGVAAALAASVADVADGTFGRLQGAATDHEAMAALLFEPAGGSGPAGQVFVNLQPAGMAGAKPYPCEGYLEDHLVDCASRQLPDGATLRTYRQADDTEFGAGSQRVVAEVIRPGQRLRVIVSAMNTNPWADGELRDRAVLTTEQLTEIATQVWWSRTDLPVEYVEAGQALDLDGD